jgi:hypothetical protein
MIIVKLAGGLGNQMFQFALGRHLAHKHQCELKLDLTAFNDKRPRKNFVPRDYDLEIFNVRAEAATSNEIAAFCKRTRVEVLDKALNKMFGTKATYIREPHFHFSREVFNAQDNVYLEGYWQTEKYFADIDSILRSEFSFREPMSDKAESLAQEISCVNSVCVNVRRGDFVTNHRHGWFGTDYFEQGERIIEQNSSDHVFYVFSDDIEWCEENLRFKRPAMFVSHEFSGRKFQDYIRLMALCKHFIIPNSSFAWWAVWFSQNPERTVIAPKRWFNMPSLDTSDLFQPNWIKI